MGNPTTTSAPGPARAGGALLGALSDAVARVRHAKPLHPRGAVLAGHLRRHGSTSGAAWVDATGDDEVLVRLSRGGGLPAWLPDVHGLALRVPDGAATADLLLSTTGAGPWLRHVLAPHLDATAGTWTSLVPYRGPRGSLMIGGRAVERRALPADAVALAAELGARPLRVRLAWAAGEGPWVPFATLDVGGAAGPALDPDVHFDPLVPPTGLALPGWVAALRAPAYARARAVVGGPAPTDLEEVSHERAS